MELLKVSGISSRIIKILLSVSVLSLLFSSLPFLSQFLNQFSANKSYVFLFCNGLMVFIAKNSPLPSDNSSSHQFNDQLDVAEPVHDSKEHDILDSAEQQEEEKRMIVSDSQEEAEVIAETEKEEEEEEKRVIVEDFPQEEEEVTDTEREEDEEEGSNNELWTTTEEEEEVEELNKKCEDFIRKMKAAFCSEPFYHQKSAMGTVR